MEVSLVNWLANPIRVHQPHGPRDPAVSQSTDRRQRLDRELYLKEDFLAQFREASQFPKRAMRHDSYLASIAPTCSLVTSGLFNPKE